jgi:hypothetical protein
LEKIWQIMRSHVQISMKSKTKKITGIEIRSANYLFQPNRHITISHFSFCIYKDITDQILLSEKIASLLVFRLWLIGLSSNFRNISIYTQGGSYL